MKLYYSPTFKGFVYTDSKRLMFNERIVDTAMLIEEIKLHAGLGSEKKETLERTVDYYKAMKKYMEKNPGNVLEASFEVDGLSVAKECLGWRDVLAFAGWNKEIASPSARFEVLAGIEVFFSDKSLGEELSCLIGEVRNGCLLPEDLELVTLIDWHLFSPLEAELLEALSDRGARISVMEEPLRNESALSSVVKALSSTEEKGITIKKDDSFEILHFEEQDEACKYLSLRKPDSFDVWINSDNKVLDDWLYLEGKPLSGSRIQGGLPQLTQLLGIGFGTLSSPMNLKNMIEWLSVPLSPLKASLRHRLESAIAREGGYFNEKCRKIIEDYVACTYDFTDLDEKEREKKIKAESKNREELVRSFLPDIDSVNAETDGTVSVQKASSFAKALYDWCGKEIAILEDDMQKAQISLVRNECAAVLDMLGTESQDRISYVKLMAFVSNLKAGVDMLQYEAEEGCRAVINNPGQLSCPVKSLVWCDFYDEPEEKLRYDFLLPGEKKAFSRSLRLWDEDVEREFNRKIKMLPFTLAEKVTLVVIDKKVTEDVEKHPVYIQMENKIGNLSDFIRNPDVNKEYDSLLKDARPLDNGIQPDAEGIYIKNAGKIQWPERETYSSFEQLVYNPFDYAFSYLADIHACGNSSLPKVYQAYGTVAHAVIEELFNKQEEIAESGTVPYIKENIRNNFDKVFDAMINGCGAVLLSKENILNLPSYKAKVFECVSSLVKVMEENNLHVLACEPWLENSGMHFEGGIKIGGYADMILADGSGNPVVFDFKWYPGKEDRFKKIIEENKSIQLELYKHLTQGLAGKKAKAVAYVVLPELTVVSAQCFAGENVVKVTVQNPDEEILQKLRNSYKYRREQISNGFIEEATGFAPEMISYQKDAEDMGLIPLEFDGTKEPKKQPKAYPEYEFFKGCK